MRLSYSAFRQTIMSVWRRGAQEGVRKGVVTLLALDLGELCFFLLIQEHAPDRQLPPKTFLVSELWGKFFVTSLSFFRPGIVKPTPFSLASSRVDTRFFISLRILCYQIDTFLPPLFFECTVLPAIRRNPFLSPRLFVLRPSSTFRFRYWNGYKGDPIFPSLIRYACLRETRGSLEVSQPFSAFIFPD